MIFEAKYGIMLFGNNRKMNKYFLISFIEIIVRIRTDVRNLQSEMNNGLQISCTGLILVLLLSCEVRTRKPQETNTPVDTTHTPENPITILKERPSIYSTWGSYYRLGSPEDFSAIEKSKIELSKTDLKLHDSFYRDYKRLLVYDQDSSRFIDPFSYLLLIDKNKKTDQLHARLGEPDQEISVYDIKAKKRKRVFFCGTTCRVDKAFWYNKDIIGLMGLTSQTADEHYQPVIWFVNIVDGSLVQYFYTKDILDTDINNFIQQEVESKGIIWDGPIQPAPQNAF
jgi:hypothetical protein